MKSPFAITATRVLGTTIILAACVGFIFSVLWDHEVRWFQRTPMLGMYAQLTDDLSVLFMRCGAGAGLILLARIAEDLRRNSESVTAQDDQP